MKNEKQKAINYQLPTINFKNLILPKRQTICIFRQSFLAL